MLTGSIMVLVIDLLLSVGMILLTRHVWNRHRFGEYGATVSAITVATSEVLAQMASRLRGRQRKGARPAEAGQGA